jgi:2-desacetyl-2-hydroxyethyl bacteriochlorophyllide A dehydrogenase
MGSCESIWFPKAQSVELRAESLSSPGPEEVRIEALASGISHGTEMLVYRGQVPADLPLDLPTLRGSFAFPVKYGYASVGRVAEAGNAVTGVEAGDTVFVLHPHQTAYVVPASLATRLPADLPPEHGVFLANVETGVNVLLDARPRLGDRVIVFGQGVIGLVLTQLLRRVGVGRVIGVDPIPARRRLARELGADEALPPEEATPAAVRALTGGIGADLAIEASGNPAALAAAVESVGQEGTVVVPSWYGTKPVCLPLGGSFHRGRVRIVSSQVGALDPALAPRWDRARRQALAIDMLARLQLDPLITHRIPFARAADAYALIDRHPEDVVQVVLTYGDADV